MSSQKHSFKVERTAHFYTIGTVGTHIERVWIACHGYGQSAEYFIRKFDVLDDGKTLVIAPEGLSKFYWNGFKGTVVASWMTSGNRLDEIDDFCNYLQAVYECFIPQLSKNAKIYLFGFSQGAATVLRWILSKQPHFHHFVDWAGWIPDELDYKPFTDYLSDKKMDLVWGKSDEFLTADRLEVFRQLSKEKGLTWHETSYKGTHKVEREVLKEVAERVYSL